MKIIHVAGWSGKISATKLMKKVEFELKNIMKKLRIPHFDKITGSTLKHCKFQKLGEQIYQDRSNGKLF